MDLATKAMTPRTWDDEDIERGLMWANTVSQSAPVKARELAEAVAREAARRADIRINRWAVGEADLSEQHDAPWYESRQTEEQWLAEMGEAR